MKAYRPGRCWTDDEDETELADRFIREEIILTYIARVAAGLPVFPEDEPEDPNPHPQITSQQRAVLQ